MQGQTSSISKRVRHSIQQVLPGTTHSFLTGTLLIGALAAFLASCCCCWACCCMAASLGRPQHLGEAANFCNRCMRRSRCRVQSILSCTGRPCRLSHQHGRWHWERPAALKEEVNQTARSRNSRNLARPHFRGVLRFVKLAPSLVTCNLLQTAV